MAVEAFGLSDVGRVRSRNEDCYSVEQDENLFIVADGMGGHGNGHVASRIAISAVRDAYEASGGGGQRGLRAIAHRLRDAIAHAHDQIRRAGDEDHSLRGMGTTLIATVVDGDSAVIGHIGDSRAYALRGTTLTQLTEDHSWVHEQVSAGHLSEAQARQHPFKSVVTRALGGDQPSDADMRRVELQEGDLLLLCSDGLTGMLTDEELTELLLEGGSLAERCDRLVRSANERGGVDNITVILLSV